MICKLKNLGMKHTDIYKLWMHQNIRWIDGWMAKYVMMQRKQSINDRI